MKCKVCGGAAGQLFSKKIRTKHTGIYYKCQVCEFLFVGNVSWIEEAYATSINDVDTGYVQRNLIIARFLNIYLPNSFKLKNTCLDFAGGYGLLVRLMRDLKFNYFWQDKYTQNLFAKDFEGKSSTYDFISGIEVAEHAEDPVVFFEELSKKSKRIFITTTLHDNVENLEGWEYLGLEHGQHISFYSKKSLNKIAEKLGLTLVTRNNFHFFVPQNEKKTTFIRMKVALFLIKFNLDRFLVNG